MYKRERERGDNGIIHAYISATGLMLITGGSPRSGFWLCRAMGGNASTTSNHSGRSFFTPVLSRFWVLSQKQQNISLTIPSTSLVNFTCLIYLLYVMVLSCQNRSYPKVAPLDHFWQPKLVPRTLDLDL